MSHSPFNWVCYVAEKARKLEADYALVIRGSETQVAEGSDVLELLKGDVKGCTLFVFAEPGTDVRARAAAAGIKMIYCGVSKKDVARLIQSGYNFKPVVLADSRDPVLRPIKIQRARDEILAQWALVEAKGKDSMKDSMKDSVPWRAWLREVAEAARRLRGDYAVLVRNDLVVCGDPDVAVLLEAYAQGCILVTFCEPDVRTLARATAAGVTAVHCVISRRDALKINLFGPVALKPVKNQQFREEALAKWQ